LLQNSQWRMCEITKRKDKEMASRLRENQATLSRLERAREILVDEIKGQPFLQEDKVADLNKTIAYLTVRCTHLETAIAEETAAATAAVVESAKA
jgi:hypothetical protein